MLSLLQLDPIGPFQFPLSQRLELLADLLLQLSLRLLLLLLLEFFVTFFSNIRPGNQAAVLEKVLAVVWVPVRLIPQ